MDALVASELRVERAHDDRAGGAEHRALFDARQHLDPVTDPLHHGGPDEHRRERATGEPVDVEVGFERVALAPEGVPAHREVDDPEAALVGAAVEHLGGAQDHSCAGAEHGEPLGHPLFEGPLQPRGVEQHRHRGRLPAGHDQGVDAGQVGGLADLDGMGAELSEGGRV